MIKLGKLFYLGISIFIATSLPVPASACGNAMHIGEYHPPSTLEYFSSHTLLLISILSLLVLSYSNTKAIVHSFKNLAYPRKISHLILLAFLYLLTYFYGYHILLSNTKILAFIDKVLTDIHNLPSHIVYFEYLHKTLITFVTLSAFFLLIKKTNSSNRIKNIAEQSPLFKVVYYFFTKLIPYSVLFCLVAAIVYSFLLPLFK